MRLRPDYQQGPKNSKRADFMLKVLPILVIGMILLSMALFAYALATGDRELLLALLGD